MTDKRTDKMWTKSIVFSRDREYRGQQSRATNTDETPFLWMNKSLCVTRLVFLERERSSVVQEISHGLVT